MEKNDRAFYYYYSLREFTPASPHGNTNRGDGDGGGSAVVTVPISGV